ncbi:MAG TPA: PAS domain S-box protein [Ktedonobacterales bacterium]|nr:PAS domain S-box protein [Ktedonobacterales bacterium]
MNKPEERLPSAAASVRLYRPAARGNKTRKQLLREISQLRGRIAELERAAALPDEQPAGDESLVALSFDAIAATRRPARAPHRRQNPALDKDRAYTHLRRQFDTTQAILDSLDQGVYGLDHEGRLNFLNAAARDILGWTRAELLGRPLHERIHPTCVHREEAEDACPVMRSLRRGETVRAENATMTHKDGHAIAVEYVSSPIISDSRVIGTVLAFQNVTRRAAAEAALRDSDARKSAVLETALDCIITMDDTGRILEFNPAAQRTFGYTREDVLGRELASLIIPPESRSSHREGIARYLANGDGPIIGKRVEMLAMRADGRRFPVELTVTTVRMGGRPVFTAYLRDITERLRLEHDLRRSEGEAATRAAVLEATFDSMADAVFVYANDGRIMRMNTLGRALLADAADAEYDTLPLSDRLALYTVEDEHGAPLLGDATPVRRILRGETLSGADAPDMVFVAPDGARKHLNVTGTPIYNEAGVQSGAVAILRDVTVRRALTKRNDEALETLRESTRLMDEFLSITSHELWNPLSAIKASIQLAASQVERAMPGVADENLQRTLTQATAVLGRAERQSGLLNRLVGDLLEMSRINLGKLTLNLAVCDIVEVADEAVRGVRLAWPGRKITLEATRPALPATADRDRVAQVLTNYLTNALKYSMETCSAHVVVAREGEQIRVSVRDQGPGLPPEEREAIWLRFHRAPGVDVLSGSGVGLGLGLNISKTIIEEHGGAVGIESVQGEGSTFWFTLPLAE